MQINADMVVLSACNTGAGKLQRGEGIESLARGFRQAGVPSLVTSLWQVDDEAAQQVVIPFFEYLADGDSKSEALREAKVKYLKNCSPDKAHPFYWAPLIVTGDNDPLPKESMFWPWIIALVGVGRGLYKLRYFMKLGTTPRA